MRKLALFVTVVCLISCYGMNADAQTTASYLGLSAKTTGAHGGQPGMTQLCRATFAGTAHMCTTDEFFSLAGGQASQGDIQAWVQPVLHNCVWNGSDVLCQEAGFVGLTVPPPSLLSTPFESAGTLYNSCTEWTSDVAGQKGTSAQHVSGTGAGTGWFLNPATDCSTTLKVACCK